MEVELPLFIAYPATAAAHRAQIPLTPEEDPQQKSALKAKKKREEAANLDRRGNRGRNPTS